MQVRNSLRAVGHVTVTTTSFALGSALISIRAVARDSVSIHTARPAHAQLTSRDASSTVVILLETFLFQRRREHIIPPGGGWTRTAVASAEVDDGHVGVTEAVFARRYPNFISPQVVWCVLSPHAGCRARRGWCGVGVSGVLYEVDASLSRQPRVWEAGDTLGVWPSRRIVLGQANPDSRLGGPIAGRRNRLSVPRPAMRTTPSELRASVGLSTSSRG